MNRGGPITWACALILLPAAFAAEPIVMEAEHANDVHLNYEIKEADDASGGLAVSASEGSGMGIVHGPAGSVPDVFVGRARFDFRIAEPGEYVIAARVTFMDKCGNSIFVRVNDGPERVLECQESTIEWTGQWQWVALDPIRLDAGAHTLRHRPREDGVRVDQWCVHPVGFKPEGKLKERWPGRFAEEPLKPVTVSFSKQSELIEPSGARRLTLRARKQKAGPVKTTIRLAGPDDMTVEPSAETPVAFAADETLKRIDVALQFPPDTPRSEKAIYSYVVDDTGVVTDASLCIVARPYDWWLLGPVAPGRKVETNKHGCPLGLARILAGEKPNAEGDITWRRLPRQAFTPFQTIDLEAIFGDRTRDAAWLYTEVVAPEEREVLALINNDGTAHVWLDNRRIFQDPMHHPAEGCLRAVPIKLTAGRHRILVRTEQENVRDTEREENYWLFRLRLRNKRTEPSDIVGAECGRTE